MDATLFELRKGLSQSSYVDDFDSMNFDTSFQWSDEEIVDNILSFENVDFLSHDLFNSGIVLDHESAKGDLQFMEEWQLHDISKASSNLGVDATSSLITELLLGCDEMRKCTGTLSKADHTTENNSQISLSDGILTQDRDLDDQLSDPTLQSVLEDLDIASLLEQFDASEGKCDVPEDIDNVRSNCADFDKSIPKNTERNPGLKTPLEATIPNAQVHNDLRRTFPKSNKYCVAGQLPRFSIILKREPEIVSSEASHPLLEHDYCYAKQATLQSSSTKNEVLSATTKCVKKMKSVLKPRVSAVVETSNVESLYSKLPDYYTSIVPHHNKQDVKCENVMKTQPQPCIDTCPKNSKVQGYYNKLPQYLTSFVNTVIHNLPKVEDNCQDEKSVVEDFPSNQSKAQDEDSPRTVSKPQTNNVQRNDGDKQEDSRNECCISPEPRSRKTPLQESSNFNWDRKIGMNSNLRNARNATSRSSSCSFSVLSHSRSRSRSRERSPSSGSRTSSSSSTYPKLRFQVTKRKTTRDNLCPKYQKEIRYSSSYKREQEQRREEEKKKQIEDRRVVHVGNIKPGTTRAELRRRFEIFGAIEDITIHHRDNRDSFGFITFTYTTDAFEALEHGNDDSFEPKYELSLGGRRLFCLDQYSDLDSTTTHNSPNPSLPLPKKEYLDFDELLKAAKDNIKPIRALQT